MGVLPSKMQVRSEWDDSGSGAGNEWVGIRLSEPRKRCLPGGFERVVVLRYSPRREVERKGIDGRHGRASRMM